jgi:tyrosine-protein phosphatase SIW14
MRPLPAAVLLLCLTGVTAAARGADLVIDPRAGFHLYRVDVGLYRSRAPRWRREFEQVRRAGVRTILDLRAYRPLASWREARLAAEYGLAYRHYRYPSLPWGVRFTEAAYRQMLREQDYPLLVHCQENRDRTGLLVGLYRVRRQGWPPEAAYDEMLRFGLRPSLRYLHRYFWENAFGPPRLPSPP